MTLWLISLGVAAAGWIAAYILGRSDGRHAVLNSIHNAQIAAAERIANATANAPTDRASVVDKLRNGGGL